jgi:hypothetical protein
MYGKDGSLLKEENQSHLSPQTNQSRVATQNHAPRLHQRRRHGINSNFSTKLQASSLNHTNLRLRGSKRSSLNKSPELRENTEARLDSSTAVNNLRNNRKKSAGNGEGS